MCPPPSHLKFASYHYERERELQSKDYDNNTNTPHMLVIMKQGRRSCVFDIIKFLQKIPDIGKTMDVFRSGKSSSPFGYRLTTLALLSKLTVSANTSRIVITPTKLIAIITQLGNVHRLALEVLEGFILLRLALKNFSWHP